MITKPVVHCFLIDGFPIVVGRGAIIEPLDHPNHKDGHSVSNTKPASTSQVLKIDKKNKTFETLNTIYKWS